MVQRTIDARRRITLGAKLMREAGVGPGDQLEAVPRSDGSVDLIRGDGVCCLRLSKVNA